MSESAYFKITTESNHLYPEIELKYILYTEWDVWDVQLLKTNTENNENNENIFKVVLFELNSDESKRIMSKIKSTAEYLNVKIKIEVVPVFSTNEFVLDYSLEEAVEFEIRDFKESKL